MAHGCSIATPVLEMTLATCLRTDRPTRFIDLGCGHGYNGATLQNFFIGWPARIVFGIEAQERYRTPLWDCYRSVLIGDLREEVPRLRGAIASGLATPYDCGLLFEVLEHLPKSDGEALLPLLPELAEMWFLSTPDREFGVAGGTPYDEHVALWSEEELRDLGWRILYPVNAGCWADLGWPMHLAVWGKWDFGGVKFVREG